MSDILIKPSATIAAGAKLSLIERSLWNILFKKAFDKLALNIVHEISEQELLSYFPYETRNTDHLKAALKRIVGTVVEYNILGKDKQQVWGVFSLLGGAELKNGVCRYSYSPQLTEKMNDKLMYAKISMHIAMRLISKHSLVLYELAMDYVKVGETPWITLDHYRSLMGIQDHEYKLYKDLNKWVTKPALKEINAKSNLHVKVTTQRTGHAVSRLKFLIGYNPDYKHDVEVFEPTIDDHKAQIINMLKVEKKYV